MDTWVVSFWMFFDVFGCFWYLSSSLVLLTHIAKTHYEHLLATFETETLTPKGCVLLSQFQHQMSVALCCPFNTCDAEDKRRAGERQFLPQTHQRRDTMFIHVWRYEDPFGSCLIFNQESR
jgi:hypothetical protein